jgi:hypothetical protein
MNKKKIKRLSLTAETLRNLSEPDLQQAAGAAPTTEATARCSLCTYACSACNPCA